MQLQKNAAVLYVDHCEKFTHFELAHLKKEQHFGHFADLVLSRCFSVPPGVLVVMKHLKVVINVYKFTVEIW